jgi:RecB family endonuclease NucS
MSNAVDRTKLCEAILAVIEQKRAETGDAQLGGDVETFLIDGQFRDLETEILQNPGAIEPWLVRRRREDN